MEKCGVGGVDRDDDAVDLKQVRGGLRTSVGGSVGKGGEVWGWRC